METVSWPVSAADRSAAFKAFARQVRDPAFRELLRTLPLNEPLHVVAAVDDEPVIDIVRRTTGAHAEYPCIIAIRRPQERFGFVLLVVDKAPAGVTGTEPSIEVASASTIGMLYDALAPCTPFVPSDWAIDVQLERVPVPG